MGVYQELCRINEMGKLSNMIHQQKIIFWEWFKRNTSESAVQNFKWRCLKECASSCLRVLFRPFLVAGQSALVSGMSELQVAIENLTVARIGQ